MVLTLSTPRTRVSLGCFGSCIQHHLWTSSSILILDLGFVPLLLTCRQLYHELIEEYFKNITLEVKCCCPSEFSGNMSSFGNVTFRNHVRQLLVKDSDQNRRKRVAAAFPNATVQFFDKGGSTSRKGAYYFPWRSVRDAFKERWRADCRR